MPSVQLYLRIRVTNYLSGFAFWVKSSSSRNMFPGCEIFDYPQGPLGASFGGLPGISP